MYTQYVQPMRPLYAKSQSLVDIHLGYSNPMKAGTATKPRKTGFSDTGY